MVREQEPIRILSCTTKTPLRFSVCGQLISPGGFLHQRRSFDVHVLIMVTEGTLYLTVNRRAYAVGAGQYIFLKAGEEHFGFRASEGKLSYLWAHFKADQEFETVKTPQEKSGGEADYLFPEMGRLAESGRMTQLFHQLMDLSLEENRYSRRMTDYAVSLLLMELSRAYEMTRMPKEQLPKAVVSACRWIKNHYYQPFERKELADALGYQPDYLSALFKKHMGISIIRYTNRMRMETAKTLLYNYDVHVKEAAFSCGFSDEKYFMKVFKEFEGMTPMQYKNSFGRKNVN